MKKWIALLNLRLEIWGNPYTEFSKTYYLSSAATFEEMIAQHNAEDHPDT